MFWSWAIALRDKNEVFMVWNLCFLIYLLQDSVLMSFEILSALIFFDISACVRGQSVHLFLLLLLPSPGSLPQGGDLKMT